MLKSELEEEARQHGLEPTGELDRPTKRMLKREYPEQLKKATKKRGKLPPVGWEFPSGGFETNRRRH